MRSVPLIFFTAAVLLTSFSALAEEPQPEQSEEQQQRFNKFAETMSGAALTGHFTVIGKENAEPRSETYEIKEVSKLPSGDYWLFTARIKYGDKDVTVPMPLEVKWAAGTPVITLEKLTIPGLGTFDSRVVIHDGRYAGTWQHGKVGGHLYGVIRKIEAAEGEKSPGESPTPN